MPAGLTLAGVTERSSLPPHVGYSLAQLEHHYLVLDCRPNFIVGEAAVEHRSQGRERLEDVVILEVHEGTLPSGTSVRTF